ncbi:ribosomal protein RPL6 [Cardiosporidium cionae]|uniref:Ribosomal protein RPL6 n=1 Tax=Cardiosporidium cionae TaxID=476202 RepID=A0ABQ7J993_9APIC|nr:ribosomal protein RPL6 [Cardiosporidium cionae]|eukprot:KAF8820533.1 ribosomal protein RPL6 [Cardiosporidium cionae]
MSEIVRMVRGNILRSSLVPGTVLIVLSGRYKGKRVVYLGPTYPKTVNSSAKAIKRLPFGKRALHAGKVTHGIAKGLKRNRAITPQAGKLRAAEKTKKAIAKGQKGASAVSTTVTSYGAPMLIVAGPSVINGVPMRRMNPRYVIATSTRIDLSNMQEQLETLSTLPSSAFSLSKAEKRKLLKEKSSTKTGTFDDDASLFVTPETVGKKRSFDTPQGQAYKDVQRAINKKLSATLKNDDLLKRYLQTDFSLRNGMYPHQMAF